jgi:hypothetical protein
LVDFATRYPEAVTLKGIETERIAEVLVDIFGRIGVPKEMLTYEGLQFTSQLMAETSRLLSLLQMTTTPYHPKCTVYHHLCVPVEKQSRIQNVQITPGTERKDMEQTNFYCRETV